jgi:hypothetical protein
MRTLFCLVLAATSALCAGPVFRFQSVQHAVAADGIRPGLMPGVGGVGLETAGLPCASCYQAPAGSVVIPPAHFIVAPAEQLYLTFYYTIETGNVSGPATSSFQVTEAGTGTPVLGDTASVTLAANSTNILSFTAQLPDGDAYKGPENVVYTTTLGGLTAKVYTHVWVVGAGSGNSDDAIHPSLMPGVAGVGLQTMYALPCMNCFGAPTGSLVLPPAYYIVSPSDEPELIFYATVEAGNVSGSETFSFQLTEASTGKLVENATGSITLTANSTNIEGFDTGVADHDRYEGLESVLFTTTAGSLTARSSSHIWVVDRASGN